MYYNGQNYCTGSDIANAFNKYLISVFFSKVDFVAESENVHSIFIDDLQFSPNKMETLLLKCDDDDSTSMGQDQVPSFVLLNASILAPLVVELFTRILKGRSWPDVAMVSQITPLHKTDPKSSTENYCPVSLPCKLSLILKRMIFKFLYPKVFKLTHGSNTVL